MTNPANAASREARIAAAELNALANLIERPPLDDVLLKQDVALRSARAIRVVLAALADEAASQPREGAWLPIATCKTWQATFMKPVIGWWTTRGATETYWDEDDDFDFHPAGWVSPSEGWRSPGDQCIPINQDSCTHWMPFPAGPLDTAPTDQAQRGGEVERLRTELRIIADFPTDSYPGCCQGRARAALAQSGKGVE